MTPSRSLNVQNRDAVSSSYCVSRHLQNHLSKSGATESGASSCCTILAPNFAKKEALHRNVRGFYLLVCVSLLFSAIPTLSRSFVAAPFQLGLVLLSVLSTLPPNPSACPRIGVWDKPWDKFANYFETASPQFHFCPGDKNGLVLRP